MVDDRLSPQYSVLGCLLIDPRTIGGAIQKLDDQDFTAVPCRMVWQAIRRLWSEGQTIDPVLVRDALTGFDDATRFLVELMEITPTAANLDHYIQVLKKQTAMDALRQIGAELQAAQTMEEVSALLAKANGLTVRKKERASMDAEEMLRSFAEDHATDTPPQYFPWAYRKLERQMYAEPGDMVIIAGRPSDGKTAFALVNAWKQAETCRVGFYSLETGVKKVRDRSMAQLLSIDMGNIKHNRITDAEWEAYAMKSGSVSQRKFRVIEASDMTVDEIFADAVARRFEIIYIDYMQLIRASNPREYNRTQIVTDISIRIHNLSRSTGIMTVALAQLNRANVENGKARRPKLSDLKESGQIEQDADAVMFIWRKDPEENNADRFLFVAKNKEGEIGEFTLAMDGRHQQFSEIVRDQLPPPRRSTHPTPVIGQDYREIKRADPDCPF